MTVHTLLNSVWILKISLGSEKFYLFNHVVSYSEYWSLKETELKIHAALCTIQQICDYSKSGPFSLILKFPSLTSWCPKLTNISRLFLQQSALAEGSCVGGSLWRNTRTSCWATSTTTTPSAPNVVYQRCSHASRCHPTSSSTNESRLFRSSPLSLPSLATRGLVVLRVPRLSRHVLPEITSAMVHHYRWRGGSAKTLL